MKMLRKLTMEDVIGRHLNAFEATRRVQLYAKGPLMVPAKSPRVAIIGTRKASSDAKQEAYELATRHECVVSGLAAGIDASAHQGAIDAGKTTIAVLGTPLDRYYPAENRKLQEIISQDHLCVSQFEEGSKVMPYNFIQRDSTIAVLAEACIIVESDDGGGALYVAKDMIRMGKVVYACSRNKGKEWVDDMEGIRLIE